MFYQILRTLRLTCSLVGGSKGSTENTTRAPPYQIRDGTGTGVGEAERATKERFRNKPWCGVRLILITIAKRSYVTWERGAHHPAEDMG